MLFGASGFVQQVVAANHLGIWVGKKGESVALLLAQMSETSGGSTLMATGRMSCAANSGRSS